jgi:hypothetical protein
MNDFSELENQLRKLRPLQPSADLVTRVERALAEERSIRLRQGSGGQASTAGVIPRESRFHFNWLSLGLGLAAAAALVLFAFLRLHQPKGKTSPVASSNPAPAISTKSNAQLIPAGLTQVVYQARDEGLHFPTNSNEPVRRVRSQSRDTLRWRNPQTGASLRISYPREEVSLIPVTGQ